MVFYLGVVFIFCYLLRFLLKKSGSCFFDLVLYDLMLLGEELKDSIFFFFDCVLSLVFFLYFFWGGLVVL